MAKADAHQIITGEDRKIQGHNTLFTNYTYVFLSGKKLCYMRHSYITLCFIH